jgi:hypothetical protein
MAKENEVLGKWRCPECGSENVMQPRYVYMNDGQIGGDDGPGGDLVCDDCQSEFEQAEFIAKPPRPAADGRSRQRVFRSTQRAGGAPGYPERSGQTVEVLQALDPSAAEAGAMFRVRFGDGVEANAFAEELHDLLSPEGVAASALADRGPSIADLIDDSDDEPQPG